MFKFIHKKLHNHYHRKYHPNYRHAKKLFVFDIALLGTAVLLFGVSIFLLFWEPGTTKLVELNVNINNERVLSGEKICFNISYKNKNKIALINPILGIDLPEGFVPAENYPLDEHSSTKIKDIPPGGNGEISICGDIWVEPKIDYHVDAYLTYIPEGTSYQEQKNSLMLLNLNGSIIDIETQTPRKSLPEKQVPAKIILKNTSAKEIKGLSLKTDPEIELENANQINLAPGEEKIYETSWGTPAQTAVFKTSVSININSKEIIQQTKENLIEIFRPNLDISGKFLNTNYAEPSITIPYQINWSNNTEMALEDLEIALNFSPAIIDINQTAEKGGLEIKSGKLTVTKKKRTALGSSQPNSSDTFTINLKTLPQFSLYKIEDDSFNITPEIIGMISMDEEQKFIRSGETNRLPIATEVNLKAQIRYYTQSGDQLGRGPLPPKVGETTKYWVFVQIYNSVNEIKDVSFNAVLADGAKFSDRQSVTIGPNLEQKNENVEWNYSKLPPHSQTGLYFEIETTPNSEQILSLIHI